MNTQTMNELLNKAHGLANTDALKSLVEDLQGFLKLQETRSQSPDNKELTAEWVAAREKIWENFDKLTEEYGITPELIKEQLKNAANFSGEHKEIYDKIKK
jgi:hypothetical protein